MEEQLTCGFKEPYLSQLRSGVKKLEGRRLYHGVGHETWRDSAQKRILHRLRESKVPVLVRGNNHVNLWYTGYSIYPTDASAYRDSFKGRTNLWWPFDDERSALSKFDAMHVKQQGSYDVVLFDVALEEPAPNGAWQSGVGDSQGHYRPPSPLRQPQQPQHSATTAAATMCTPARTAPGHESMASAHKRRLRD